jgi:putative ATP-dependent endonuclease of the OLD family
MRPVTQGTCGRRRRPARLEGAHHLAAGPFHLTRVCPGVLTVDGVFGSHGAALNTVLLEEPEMYLYPQAQRYFKNILVDLVDRRNAQIILSTHSPIFADVNRFGELRVLRRQTGQNTTVSRVDSTADIAFLSDQLKRAKLEQYVDSRNSELLFARAVLLVEGHGDRLAALHVAAKRGFDLDAEGLSVVACGGKSAIPFFARLCRSLAIPFVILHDADIYHGDDLAPWQVDENKSAPAKNAAIAEAAGTDATIIQVTPTLEAVLGIGRNASDKPMRVISALQSMSFSDFPTELNQAIESLADLVNVRLRA